MSLYSVCLMRFAFALFYSFDYSFPIRHPPLIILIYLYISLGSVWFGFRSLVLFRSFVVRWDLDVSFHAARFAFVLVAFAFGSFLLGSSVVVSLFCSTYYPTLFVRCNSPLPPRPLFHAVSCRITVLLLRYIRVVLYATRYVYDLPLFGLKRFGTRTWTRTCLITLFCCCCSVVVFVDRIVVLPPCVLSPFPATPAVTVVTTHGEFTTRCSLPPPYLRCSLPPPLPRYSSFRMVRFGLCLVWFGPLYLYYIVFPIPVILRCLSLHIHMNIPLLLLFCVIDTLHYSCFSVLSQQVFANSMSYVSFVGSFLVVFVCCCYSLYILPVIP